MLKKLSKKLSIMLAILLIITSLLGFLTPTGVIAEEVYATDLFFSEYVEGSSYNKAIEIFNGTANAVELAQYTVELYSNGATTTSNKITLSGNLDSGEVYVIVYGSASDSFKTYKDLENNTVTNFNGDDALVLKHNGVIIDSFGQVGVDPGNYWGTAENNTLDHTLVRKSSITIGDPISDDAFDPSIEWDFDVKDTYSKLGSHIMDGFGSGEPGTIAAVTAVPREGAVAVGTRVSLSCTTEGAVIMYSINEGEDVVYNNTEQITLDVLPASINAYATKDGQSGAISTFNYTQAQVAVVTASPAAGAVYTGTEVNLSTATDGAAIFYRIGEDVVETEYSAPIVISEATTIKAIAKKSGLSDSNEATFSYTIKAPEEEITIAEARATALESKVEVTGVVTWMDGATKAYIQDETAAIVVDLYYIPGTKPTFVIGDEVTAIGTLVKYNQLLTVKLAAAADVVKASSNNALPEPKLITIADAKTEIYEAQLVKLEGLTLGTATGDYTPVTDAANDTINVYRIALPTGIIAGDIVNAIAIVSKYTSGYQLRIRSAGDVTKIEAPDTIPPVITHIPVIEGNTGLDLNIKAVVTDNKQVSTVNLSYRTIGENTYTNSAMIFSNGEYAYAIPKIKLQKAGLEYYIQASDGINTTTAPANIETPYSVTISEIDIAAPEVTNIAPTDGSSTGDNLRPIISANYNDTSGIDISSVKVYFDDTEITAQCTIGENGFTTTPTSDLTKGQHIVRVFVKDNAAVANQAEVSWKFYVGEDVYNFYFGQLHSHTGEISDGEGTLDDAYTWARDKGMADFFAVTDHSNWFDNEKDLINESITRIDNSTSAEWKKANAKADYYNKDGEFVAI
ncbi:MAG: hypothetical protein K0Q65_3179, partial [Clostridia bacterium]|nr:hypothetical protein [Clostridia bacterium]